LESITMNGVQAIPTSAFKDYKKLTSASFNAATTIGESAFEGSGLTAITIPSTVKTVNKRAFANCTSATSVLVKTSYASYNSEVFDGLPTTAKAMCDDGAYYITNNFNGAAFANPASLTGKLYNASGYEVSTINASSYTITQVGYCALYNVKNVQKVYLPKTVTQIGGWAFASCTGLTTFKLAEGSAVTVGNNAFSHLPATEIQNSGCITKLGTEACIGSKITTFNCTGLKEIPESAFKNCESLSNVSGIGNITTIGNYAFYNTAENVSFLSFNSLTSIGDYAFALNKSQTGVTFNSKLTTIGKCAFQGCTAIGTVSFSNSLQPVTVGSDAFKECTKVVTLIIPALSTYCKFDFKNGYAHPLWDSYGAGVATVIKYSSSNITNLVIPGTITRVNNFCFCKNTNIKTVKLEENVKEIGFSTFNSAKALTTITLPSTLTKLEDYAISYSGNLTSITCDATTVPSASTITFDGITYTNVTLNVPADTKSKYSVATGWKNFSSKTIQTCAAPEISTLNGNVVFKTTTPNSFVHYDVEYAGSTNSNVGIDSKGASTGCNISPKLKITAYTYKADHANSPTVTKTITLNTPGLKGDVNLDGVVNIADVTEVVNKVLGK
ncbi:MAG: leucine-rich repeat protein, partial [Bacteroidaceae bacterium]|nr:leucine-rich repeat protein [Bacteroidaceae bacterium]